MMENDELDLIISKITKSIIEINKLIVRKSIIDLSSVLNSNHNYENNKILNQSNSILKKNLLSLKSIKTLLSNNDNIYNINIDGKYLISYDALDDILNLDYNMAVGTIFCVFEYCNDKIIDGNNIVLSGYSIYNLSTNLVICKYGKVDIYSLDIVSNKWAVINSNYKMRDKGLIFSIGESNLINFKYNNYVNNLINNGYKSKYIGSIVYDFHRTLIKGGLIINITDNKDGGLNLVYKAYALAYIIEKAEGMSLNENFESILNIPFPNDINKIISVFLGSEYEIFKLIY
jgi:fructose-1,6-bisphosphatase I